MKVLIGGINYAPELTGIGKYTGEMACELARRGHEVRVITAPPYYPSWSFQAGHSNGWSQCMEDGVRVHRCPIHLPTRDSGLQRVLHLLSFALTSAPVFLRQILWRPDVVWVVEPTFAVAPMAWLTARLSGSKAWLHVQDFELDVAFELGLLKPEWMRRVVLRFERFMMMRFDRLSTISAAMRARLMQKGIPVERIRDFPNWANTDLVRPLSEPSEMRQKLGISDTEVVALYSGNMGQKQGLELVIEAAWRLQNTDDSLVRIVMCGDGAMKTELQKASRGLDNMTWLPLQPVDRLNELLNIADIHLLPQKAGAADLVMPSKLTNMLASGRPVVATVNVGTDLHATVKKCGIATQPGEVADFTAAIYNLASQPEVRQRLGEKARDIAERYLNKYEILSRFDADLLNLIHD